MFRADWNVRRLAVFCLIGLGALILVIKLLAAIWLASRPDDWFRPSPEVSGAATNHLGNSVVRGIFNGGLSLGDDQMDDHQKDGHWRPLPLQAPYPEDNLPSVAKITLGEALFFDKRLSHDGTVACASCHKLSRQFGGADGLQVSEGIAGAKGARNAPTVYNSAFQSVFFWDGRVNSLEEQAKGPFVNPVEMGMPSLSAVEARVSESKGYRAAFARAFPDDVGRGESITIDHIVKAIASYERTLITPESPYDRFVRGDRQALDASQQRGMALFRSVGCSLCHSGPNFSAASVFVSEQGLRPFPVHRNQEYEQRYGLTQDLGVNSGTLEVLQGSSGVWRVPSLRNVALTAPYFHNGSVETLEDAVRVMARVQLNKTLDNRLSKDWEVTWSDQERRFYASDNLVLTDQDVADLVRFLEGLSGI